MAFSPQTRGRCWIATVHTANMEKAGLTKEEYEKPEHLAEHFINLWENSGKDRRAGIAVCVSSDGCYHCHMACYGNTTTLKKVSDVLCNSHVEPQLGGKDKLKAYLLKEGEYAEKGEQVLYAKGLDVIEDNQGRRNDLEDIEEMLIRGMTPQEILDTNFKYYRYENMILHAYINQRIKQAPIRINLTFEYHVGMSGSGKTFTYNKLCEELGADNIYVLTDYDNNASGGLDSYSKAGAPPVLFMDDFKGIGISYGKLLTMLNGYSRMQTHSRYSNTYNLWERVLLTSVYPPEMLYNIMVPNDYRTIDSYEQLLRRITTIVYHYREGSEYKTYAVDGKGYINYEDLRSRAQNSEGGFRAMTEAEQRELPFKEE